MKLQSTLLTSLLLINTISYAEKQGFDEHQHEEHEQQGFDKHDAYAKHEKQGFEKHDDHDENETKELVFSKQQRLLAKIQITKLQPQVIQYQVYAPGEIKLNGYHHYLVSPRVDSVVLQRHATLGEHISKGKALVSLFSDTVAQAQATYRIANAEWQRVKKLGIKAMGIKRYGTAKTEYDAAKAKLFAFGLTKSAIKLTDKPSTKLGEYTLVAQSSGIVISDEFHQGQAVSAGSTLVEIADESTLWLEARLSANSNYAIPVGSIAKFKVAQQEFEAKVIQKMHIIDPQTRTRTVRLLVDNKAHLLHAGLFADIYFTLSTKKEILAVPEEALMRGGDGDWVVFVEHKANSFEPQEVKRLRTLGKWQEIEGLKVATPVVIKGAFFIASEQAKSGFDPHDH